MEEYRDDKKSKLYYMDEILHKISSMSQAENEKQPSPSVAVPRVVPLNIRET